MVCSYITSVFVGSCDVRRSTLNNCNINPETSDPPYVLSGRPPLIYIFFGVWVFDGRWISRVVF